MARPLRIEYGKRQKQLSFFRNCKCKFIFASFLSAWYHFTSRGNERNPIFKGDLDRKEFLNILKDNLEKYMVRLHGDVLMENHFHLILHTPSGNLNRFAQRFNTSYTVYYNRRNKCYGHLYQGRYKAIFEENDSYLSALSRYIHLNPVRIKKIKKLPLSGQIECLRAYRWSSNLGYGLLRYRNDFMCYHGVLEYIRKRLKGKLQEDKSLGFMYNQCNKTLSNE